MARFLGAGTRRVLLIGGSVVAVGLGAAGLVVWANTRPPEQPASEARRMPPVDPLPGGPNNTAALDELLSLPADERAAMGRAGRARFADRFRAETMVRRLRSLYERLLAGGRPGDPGAGGGVP